MRQVESGAGGGSGMLVRTLAKRCSRGWLTSGHEL